MAKKWTAEEIDLDKYDVAKLVVELLDDIREQDKEDLLASGNDEAFAVIGSIRLSEKVLVYRGEDGKLLCILGVGLPSWQSVGRGVWMIGTNELYNGYVKEVLVKEGYYVFHKFAQEYGLIHNVVYEKNKTSIRYLKYLGAVFLTEAKVTADGKKFCQFYMTADYRVPRLYQHNRYGKEVQK